MSKTKGSTHLQYKIRTIVKFSKNSSNPEGEVYGITIPRKIAKNFLDCYFQIEVIGKDIILHSGCDIREEAKKENFDDYTISKKKVLSVK